MAHLVINENGKLKSRFVPGTVDEVKSFYRTKLGETVIDIFSTAQKADRKILMIKSTEEAKRYMGKNQ